MGEGSSGASGRVGRAAETFAARWLQARGLHILARRYRCPDGEIDIVARDRRTIVVVEVKARTSAAFGAPEESVDRIKRKRLRAAARHYLWASGLGGCPVRFDVLAIAVTDGRATPRWIRHAFDA